MINSISSGFKIENDESKNYFGKMKRILKILGISLTNDNSLAYNFYTFCMFSVFVFGYIIISIKIIFTSDTYDDTRVMYLVPFSAACVKSVYIWIYRNEVGTLLSKLEKEPFIPNAERGGDVGVKLMKKCAWLTNMQVYICWMGACISIMGDAAAIIYKRLRYQEWKFPYGTYDVVNVTYSPNYEICCTYQIFCFLLGAGRFITIDLIIAAMLAHISFHYKILQNNITNMLHTSYANMIKDIEREAPSEDINEYKTPWKYLKKSVVEVVNYHLDIIGIAEEVEKLLKGLFLIVYIMTLATIGFLLYRASKYPVGDPRLFGAVGEVFVGCAQVLMFCYWGEEITFQSQEVGTAAYESSFVGTDIRYQKSLGLVILRSQKPTSVTANKFTVIGLSTFLWIIRTSYSAFMMLRNMQN